MRFENSTLKSFLKLALSGLLLSLELGCASGGKITNARVCSEIPFVDGAEGACVWTVTQKTELVNATDWAKQRPYMLMIDAESWTNIKKDWLKACRLAGPNCNVMVDSVDRVVKALDSLASSVLKKP